MGSLSKCLAKNQIMGEDDIAEVSRLYEANLASGMSPRDAELAAARAVLADLESVRAGIWKQIEAAPVSSSPIWLDVEEVETPEGPTSINRYYVENPDMMLGKMRLIGSMYGKGEPVLIGPTDNLDEKIIEAVKAGLPENVITERGTTAQELRPVDTQTDGIKDGAYYLKGKALYRKVAGVGEPINVPRAQREKIEMFLGMRDVVNEMLAIQGGLKEARPERMGQLRKGLNEGYDAFVKAHGPIKKTVVTKQNRKDGKEITIKRFPNISAFEDDPDAYKVAEVEVYDEKTDTAKKAAIFTQDIVSAYIPPDVQSPADALAVSLNEKGGVDISLIANRLGLTEAEAIAALGEQVFLDPVGETYRTASEYLAGDVVGKLETARTAAETNPAYERNVAALAGVQPEPLTRADIRVPFGAPYIPVEVYEQYLTDVLKARRIKLRYDDVMARWYLVEGSFPPESEVQFGTKRRSVGALVEAALNSATISITYKDDEGKTIREPEAEAEARAKVDIIKDTFSGDPEQGIEGWLWGDYTRATRIEAAYNNQFNRIVQEKHDGSHLTFPGLARVVTAADGSTFTIDLKPHRVNAIWKVIKQGNALFNHAVGSGKAQPLDAKVLTPDGWKRMGDIRVGDQVIAGDGSATTVLGVYPQGVKPIYRIRFSDGAVTECCDEHLWVTQTRRERGRMRDARCDGRPNTVGGMPKVRPLSEIRTTLDDMHFVPTTGAVQHPKVELPLDPYTLGALIGDASFRQFSVQFGTKDAEILDQFLFPDGAQIKGRVIEGRCPIYWITYGGRRPNPLNQILRDMGLWWLDSRAKFIPERYKFAHADDRLGLLQGLMDTDGGITGRSCRFTSYSKTLADDVAALARSLGGVASVALREAADGSLSKYVANITLPAGVVPFRLSRKVAAYRALHDAKKTIREPLRAIVAVDLIGHKEAQCIAIEHPTKLYVTDDYVVTHNTWTSIMASMEMKRLGMIQRPLFCVPNHMLNQFATEFYQAYPNAKLLIATKDQMNAKNRKRFAARIAADTWDGIIITHSSFGKLGLSKQAYQDYYREQMEELEAAMKQAQDADDESAVSDMMRKWKKFNEETGGDSDAEPEGITVKNKRRPTNKQKEAKKDKAKEKLKKLVAEEDKDDGVVFEETGIDFMFVDEAHLFKSLPFQTMHTRIKGIGGGSSKRAVDLFLKMRHLEKSRPGRSAVFMTGTPVSNTMAELYTMQRYLQGPTLKKFGIDKFDAWAGTFGKIVTKSELASNSRDYKDTESFSEFVNMPELMTIAGSVMDTQTAEMLKLPRPELKGGKLDVVQAQLSPDEEGAINDLIAKMEKREKDDPFLPLFTAGIQLATDMRLVDPSAPFNPNGKIAQAVNNIFKIWEEGNADPAAPNKGQLVFLDMGVPGSKGKAKAAIGASNETEAGPQDDAESAIDQIRKELAEEAGQVEEGEEVDVDEDQVEAEALLRGKFNLYQDIKDRLIAKGVPKDQIAFIHDAKNDDQKAKMFEKMRSGDIRVMIGSTGKMGVGTNVQKLLYAMHHLDAPWRPADLEQRDGRILRQGNKNKEVRIFRYITVKSFDAYRWQLLDRKSQFIGQLYAGAAGVRHMEDITPPLPEAAELKAAATGNPLIIERAELEREVKKLEVAERAHYGSQRSAAENVKKLAAKVESLKKFNEQYEQDAPRVEDLKGDNFKVKLDTTGKPTVVTDRKKAGEFIKTYLKGAGQQWYKTTVDLGEISSFAMRAEIKRGIGGVEVLPIIEGTATYQSNEPFLMGEDADPAQVVQRWVRLVTGVPAYTSGITAQIAGAETTLPKMQEAAQPRPFPQTDKLVDKRKRLETVIADLNKKPVDIASLFPKKGEPVRSEELDPDVWKDLKLAIKKSQGLNTVDGLMEMGAEAHAQLTEATREIFGQYGVEFKDPGPKSRARAEEKLLGRPAWHLTDVARAGATVTSVEQADNLVAALAARFPIVDEGWAMTSSGYFDRKIMVILDNGIVGEFQMWPPGMLDAKEFRGGHTFYEEARRPGIDPETKARLEAQQRELYAAVVADMPMDLQELAVSRASAAERSAAGYSAESASRETEGASRSGALSTGSGLPRNQEPSSLSTAAAVGERTAGVPSQSKYPNVMGGSPSTENIGETGENRKVSGQDVATSPRAAIERFAAQVADLKARLSKPEEPAKPTFSREATDVVPEDVMMSIAEYLPPLDEDVQGSRVERLADTLRKYRAEVEEIIAVVEGQKGIDTTNATQDDLSTFIDALDELDTLIFEKFDEGQDVDGEIFEFADALSDRMNEIADKYQAIADNAVENLDNLSEMADVIDDRLPPPEIIEEDEDFDIEQLIAEVKAAPSIFDRLPELNASNALDNYRADANALEEISDELEAQFQEVFRTDLATITDADALVLRERIDQLASDFSRLNQYATTFAESAAKRSGDAYDQVMRVRDEIIQPIMTSVNNLAREIRGRYNAEVARYEAMDGDGPAEGEAMYSLKPTRPVNDWFEFTQNLKMVAIPPRIILGEYRVETRAGHGTLTYTVHRGRARTSREVVSTMSAADETQIGRFYLRTDAAPDGFAVSVQNMAVDPEYQGRGIATTVFDMIERDIETTGVRFLPPPVETLSEDGKAFWNARDPEALANRERMERDVYFGDDVAARIGVNAPGVATTPAFDAKRAEFEAELLRIAKRIKDKGVQVEVQNRIRIGKYELNGYYDSGRKLIKLALESGLDRALTTIRHEEIHALRDLGLLSDAEWKLLTGAANKARVRADIGQDTLVEYRQNYAARVAKVMLTRRGFVDLVQLPWADVEAKLADMFGFDPANRVESLKSLGLWDEAILQDLLDEEAVAVLVSERMGGQSYGTKVDAIVDRIAQFLKRLTNALRGLGFQTVEDVFQAIDEGTIGKRDATGGAGEGVMASMASDNDPTSPLPQSYVDSLNRRIEELGRAPTPSIAYDPVNPRHVAARHLAEKGNKDKAMASLQEFVERYKTSMPPISRRYAKARDLLESGADLGVDFSDVFGEAQPSRDAKSGKATTKTNNLDMSQAAKRHRAQSMGFDTSRVFFRGDDNIRDIKAFDLEKVGSARKGLYGNGIYLSALPEVAESYGPVGMFYVRAKKTFVFDDRDPNMIAKIEAIFPSADTTITAGDGLSLRQTAEWTQALKDAGYDSIAVKNRRGEDEEFVVLDTRNIRSVDAAFDPAQSDSANLMFSLAGGRDTGLLPDNILASLAKWGNYQPLGIGTNPQYPNSETEAPEKGLSDVVADTVKALDLEGMARQGRLDPDMKRAARKMGGEMMGQTNRATGVVRLALKNDMATLAHEGGHALEIRASVRDDLSAIKTQFAEDLTVPPAANAPVPMFPQTGFSGIELDQDSIRLAIESVDAERQMRTLAAELAVLKSRPRSRQQEARFQQITPMYEQFQSVAGGNRETLVRRFGADRADAVLLDLMPVDRATAPAYAATRFSKSGQPTPRVVIPPTDVELSEGFAEWFRIYLTNPKQAQALSRGFYDAFEDMLDAAEPEMLTRFQMVQEGVGALAKAAPVSAVRARVQSTVQPGFIEAIRLGLSEAAEAGRIAAETARRTGDGNQVAAMISGFSGEIWRPMGDRLYGFYHAAFDARHPMKKAVQFLIDKAVENSGVKLGKGERAVVKALHDPYKLWRLAEHSKTHATAALQFGIVHKGQIDPSGPSYWDALTEAFGGSRRGQWNDDMAEMFGSYLIGRRMLAEFSRYDRGELENVPDTIISRDVWQKSTAQLEKEYPQFKRAAQTMYRFGQELLRYKFEAGFLTQEQFDEYRNRVDYTPLNRIMDAGTPSMLGGSSNANKRRLIYRFQGSTRDFINPLETIAQDMFATQQRVEMNRVIGAMDRVARAAGPGGGAIAERIPAKQMKATRIRVADVASLAKPLRGALARTGLDKADRDSLLADAQNEMRDTMRLTAMQSGLSMDDQQMLLDTIDLLFDGEASKTIFQSTDISEAGEPIVYLWEGGQRIPIRMGDNEIAKDIFEGFQAFGSNDTNPLVDAAALGTQALRAGITKAPSYVLVNYLRDQLSTWVLSDNFVPFVTGAKGLKSALTSDAVGKRYAAFAGLMGGVDANLIDQAANKHDVLTLRTKGFFAVPAKSGIGQVWQRSLKAMEITEAGTRFGHFEAAFNRAKADGMSEEEAAFEAAYAAHDVIDFSRRGSKTMEVSRIVAFLNAALQGLDSTRRAFTGERDAFTGYRALITPYIKATNGTPLSVAERKGLPMAARTFNKMVVLGMIGLTLSMLYKDDEEYEEFNDYMKATHWFFKIGDTWYRFPKPFDLAIFSQIFEGAFDRVVKQDPRAGEKFMQSLKHTMVPPHEVNVANLYYEMVTGIDTFRNREIVPMDLSKLPPELQFGAYTSEMGRMIGSITGMSPQKVDHLMGGLLGTIGRDIQTVSDAVLPMANEALGGPLPGVSDRPRADKSFEDTVILSRFTRRAGRGSLSSETFWKQMKNEGGEYTSAAEGYKSLRNSGRGAEARDLLANVSDDQRAYAILEVEFAEKEQDINPLNRAKQVMSAMSGIRKEMVLGRLYKGNMTSKEIYKAGDDAEEIVLQPSKQKIVNEILEDLSMREARNALVAVGLPGWAQKDIMPTDGLMKELEAAAPEVAEELALRLTKGRNKVYPFEGVRRAWAGAREELLAKGAEADLSEFVADAKGWEPDDAPVSRPAGMMRLGGPVETNPTMEVSDDLAADLEFSAAGRPFLPEPDEDTEGGWMDGVGQEREAFTPSGP